MIGAGPKGLFAAERLLAHLGQGPAQVTLVDPHPPGCGAAYRLDQPAWLRLNVASSLVDAGWHTGPQPSPDWLITFDQWRQSGEELPLDPFPPRAQVGAYLAWVWDGLLRAAPAGVRLRHRAAVVTSVTASNEGWLVGRDTYDEVLLACGHAADWPGALRHHWTGPERLVDRVYPVDGLDAIRPGEAVATRGAALTFIDAALALTEGRGGRFSASDGHLPTGYLAAGTEPRVIWPTSRTGRLPSVKPQPGSGLATLERADAVDASSRRLQKAGSGQAAVAEVGLLARELLARAGGTGLDDVAAVVGGDVVDGDPAEALRRSLAIATGSRRPDATWAVGQAWRDVYPALVARFSGTEADNDFDVFAAMAGRLESVAFGPPPVNAAKLLALIEGGIVDPSSLNSASAGPTGFAWVAGGPPADVVVDAVLPPPGATTVPGSLPGHLVATGLVAGAAGRRGLAIDDDGTCLDPAGDRREGLAAVGRPTEDVTIGNDTLSRTLHPTTERWAARVARRLAVAR